jgi:hypothetical protein
MTDLTMNDTPDPTGTLIRIRTGMSRDELLRALTQCGPIGKHAADQVSAAAHHLDNMTVLLKQAIHQAITDLTWALTSLNQNRPVNPSGVLQGNGLRVDVYAARVDDGRARLNTTLALAVRILSSEQPDDETDSDENQAP